ncbi:MAG TPA: replicative DNA helicase [Streptomyces sp.]|nr:replicative DNA helicase [Streptomyces sp.]
MTDLNQTQPPHDSDAERAVLGATLFDNTLIDGIAATVQPADMWQPAHQTIYGAILHMHGDTAAPTIDPITLAAQLRTDGDLERCGGASYLHELAQAVPTVGHAPRYAEIIAEQARLRAVLAAAQRAATAVHRREFTADQILDHTLGDLQAATPGTADATRLDVASRWTPFLLELEAGRDPRALDTPWPDLNEVVELKPGQLVTVGAATGGGKSLFGMNLAAHVALTRGKPVLVASLEMGGSELMARLTAAEASVGLNKLIHRQLDDHDWAKIIKAGDRLQNADKFVLDDSANLTVSKIRSRMRWMAAQGNPPALVVADYLQLLTPEGVKATHNRAQEVAELSRGLKLLAMEFEIPVIALAQFNRNHVGRRPVVTDFKDSSAIEQDSNVIVLMHRPLAEDGSDTGPRAGEIDLIVAKNRNGAAGRIVPLIFQGHYARLRSMGRA